MMLANFIDRLNEQIGRGVSWGNAVLVILVCVDVFFRKLFSETAAWVMELEWHLFALVFLLGGGYALKHNRHVRVDLFYSRFSSRDQALVDLIGHVIFLIPWCLVLVYFAGQYAWESFLIGETSPDPGGLAGRFLIKGVISLGFLLLFLQGVSESIKSWKQYNKQAG